jgi:DNA-binding transcriptional LysR family regulator
MALHSRLDIEQWDGMRNVEFAIAMLPTSNPTLRSYPLIKTRAVAVLHKAHALADHDALNPEAVRGHPVLMQSGRLLRARIDAVHKSHGFELEPVLESSSSFTCCRLAGAGLGIAISDPFSPTDTSSMEVREWQPEIVLEYGLLMPRNTKPSSTVNRLVEIITEQMKKFERG